MGTAPGFWSVSTRFTALIYKCWFTRPLWPRRYCNPAMHTSSYFAGRDEPHPCWQCRHYGGPLPDNDVNRAIERKGQ